MANKSRSPALLTFFTTIKPMAYAVGTALLLYFGGKAIANRLHLWESPVVPVATAPTPTVNTPSCASTAIPANGAQLTLDPAIMQRSDVAFTGIEFTNKYMQPIAATLTTKGTPIKSIVSIIIHPGQKATLSAPVGSYGINFMFGSQWCDTSFRNGEKISIDEGLTTKAGETSVVEISASSKPNDLHFQLQQQAMTAAVDKGTAEEEPIITGEGMIIRADPLGHYRLTGRINNYPIRFVVDSGASVTAVSRQWAAAAGIKECQLTGTALTANGAVNRCTARVSYLEFGSFRLSNITITVLDYLEGDALLGTDVLRHFRLEQSNNRLTITRTGWQR